MIAVKLSSLPRSKHRSNSSSATFWRDASERLANETAWVGEGTAVSIAAPGEPSPQADRPPAGTTELLLRRRPNTGVPGMDFAVAVDPLRPRKVRASIPVAEEGAVPRKPGEVEPPLPQRGLWPAAATTGADRGPHAEALPPENPWPLRWSNRRRRTKLTHSWSPMTSHTPSQASTRNSSRLDSHVSPHTSG